MMKKNNNFIKIVLHKFILIVCIMLILLMYMGLYTNSSAYYGLEKINLITILNEPNNMINNEIPININMQSRKTEQMDELNWITTETSGRIGQINISNNGSVIDMKGNEANPGSNIIYLIPETPQGQILQFDYNIEYGDSFEAAGVIIKVRKIDNTLTGYMLSFNNTNSGGTNWYIQSSSKLRCNMEIYIYNRK